VDFRKVSNFRVPVRKMCVNVPVCVIVPNGQTVVETWRLFDFQDGGRRHLGFLKLQILRIRRVKGDKMRHHAKFHGDRCNHCRCFGDFSFLSIRCPCHLGLSKCPYFRVGRLRLKRSKCVTVSNFARLVKPLLRYGDFSIFQEGGRRHIGFSKCGNFRGGKGEEGQNVSLCQILR